MNIKTMISFFIATFAILVVAVLLLYRFGNSSPENTVIADVAGEERWVRGSGEITLVEFSDFQCPACQAVHGPLKQLLTKYDGKVKLVYRHFPLTSIHENALVAAEAAEAAGRQGKFFEMHDLLFAKQKEWEKNSSPKDKFVEYAKELGLDEGKFRQDMESEDVKDSVDADMIAANKYKLSGTPTLFLNGQRVEYAEIEPKILELTSNPTE